MSLRASEIERLRPELAKLARDGVLRVVRKPAQYVDRRERRFWKGPREPREPSTIWILGTCHVSEESARQVKQVIESVRPQAVVVELCKKRSGALNLVGNGEGDQERGAGQLSLGSVMAEVSGRGGGSEQEGDSMRESWVERTSRDAIKGMLSAQAERIGRELNVLPGSEFKAAAASARKVGAEIVLGDRPFDITLKRCWSTLTLRERLNLVFIFFTSLLRSEVISKRVADQISAMEAGEDGVDLDMVFDQVTSVFPNLREPLFRERDRYMAWTLKRSKAVTNCTEVVGVIGLGHLSAVVSEIEEDYVEQHLSFKRVARLKY